MGSWRPVLILSAPRLVTRQRTTGSGGSGLRSRANLRLGASVSPVLTLLILSVSGMGYHPPALTCAFLFLEHEIS